MLLANTLRSLICHCEEWNDEAISVLVNWRLLRALALAMTIFRSLRLSKPTLLLRIPINQRANTDGKDRGFQGLAITSVMNSVHALFYAEEEGLKNS